MFLSLEGAQCGVSDNKSAVVTLGFSSKTFVGFAVRVSLLG